MHQGHQWLLEFVGQTGYVNVPGFFSVLQMAFRLCMSEVWELAVIFVLGSVVLDYLPTQAGLLVDQVEF